MRSSENFWKWYCMPLTVLLIGVISISLFFAIHRVRVHQYENTILSNAILHVEVDTTLFHLKIEEFTAGEAAMDRKGAIASMDRAIDQADAILKGGTSDSKGGSASGMVALLELQKPLEELKSLLVAFKRLGLWRLDDISKRGAASAADQQFDEQFDEILAKASLVEQICKRDWSKNLLRSRLIVLSIYLVWAFVITSAATGMWRIEMRRKKAEEALLEANSLLFAQAEELTLHRENLSGLVKERTAALTISNEHLHQEIADRRQAEKTLKESEEQIRQLSLQLLMAQEFERKRISMELHDGLGQALNVIKLRIRIVNDELDHDPAAARDDCGSLQEYLNEVVEDVRRLSQDLSPSVLEDLGLTSALRWLVSNFRASHAMSTVSEIAEIDGLFPENHCITIYRVIQEALTNAGKHSRAANLSVVIRRQGDRVSFTVEDDGAGFDPRGTLKRAASQMGLGLITMKERVRMMGGVFELWSHEGEGTRIAFSVTVGHGGG